MTQEFVYGVLSIPYQEPQLRVPEIYTSLKKARESYRQIVDIELKWRGSHKNIWAQHFLLKIRLNSIRFTIIEQFN